eukprot:CAMPEP_0182606714 /NCGR_PEP_ID=MMETSP1330-20130603/1526_1 /TAXON_ID=464278 /ORGANISM="Picochlorum sp., Strain RCC944" /LENGTH=306 /DNA_ID=CAMNT_0024825123 /DNA_START=362 /DNA_END=1280 /DNA_ORIENTATION=-
MTFWRVLLLEAVDHVVDEGARSDRLFEAQDAALFLGARVGWCGGGCVAGSRAMVRVARAVPVPVSVSVTVTASVTASGDQAHEAGGEEVGAGGASDGDERAPGQGCGSCVNLFAFFVVCVCVCVAGAGVFLAAGAGCLMGWADGQGLSLPVSPLLLDTCSSGVPGRGCGGLGARILACSVCTVLQVIYIFYTCPGGDGWQRIRRFEHEEAGQRRSDGKDSLGPAADDRRGQARPGGAGGGETEETGGEARERHQADEAWSAAWQTVEEHHARRQAAYQERMEAYGAELRAQIESKGCNSGRDQDVV